MTLAAGKGFDKHARATRKGEFLSRLEALVPWAEFCALIEPHYPKAGNGRPPVGCERILLLKGRGCEKSHKDNNAADEARGSRWKTAYG